MGSRYFAPTKCFVIFVGIHTDPGAVSGGGGGGSNLEKIPFAALICEAAS